MKERTVVTLALLIIGFGVGFSVERARDVLADSQNNSHTEVRGVTGYTYINPLLECDVGAESISSVLRPFKSKLDDIISSEKDLGDVKDASVYFRDMNNGPWFGIGQDTPFRPASLLKVPLMMNIYKLDEVNPGFLEKPIIYDGADLGLEQNYKPSQQVVKGKTYTIGDLVKYMVVYSDNKATAELLKQVDDSRLNDLLGILGIEVPKNNTGQDNFVTLRQYAGFFRILFNASYNSYDLSEKALGLLAQSDFSGGIRAGVPSNILVAHKFGESADEGDNNKELNDCGIVYYPKKPYLLCTSVKGTDFDRMERAIRRLSQVAYKEVDSQLGQ